MKRVSLVVAALFVMSVLVFAQGGVAGKWTGEAQGRGGAQPVTLDVKADGGKLTGTLMQGQNSSPIADGKVDGMKISFTTTQNFNGNDVQITWSGEVKGDELTLTRSGGRGGGGRGPQPITLKRSN